MPKVTTKRVGRPSLKTPKLIDEILARIIGGKNIVELCADDDMPSRDSIHHWLAEDQEFSDKYVRACGLREEGDFYGMRHVAKTEPDVNRARLIVDTMKWQLSKEKPKKYGDKIDMTTNGKDLPTPILGTLNVHSHDSDTQDPEAE